MRFSILHRLFPRKGAAGRISAGTSNSGCGSPMLLHTGMGSKFGASPSLMLPPTYGRSGNILHYNFYSLAEDRVVTLGGGGSGVVVKGGVRLVGSSHGWLALFSERSRDLFLTNPLSGSLINLPPLADSYASKVILSCSPDDDGEECRAMMISGRGNRLAFCSPGRSSAWTGIGDYPFLDNGFTTKCYEDIVYSRKKKLFFCLTNDWEVEGWDVTDPGSPSIGRKHSLGTMIGDDPRENPWMEQQRDAGVSVRRYLVFSDHSDHLYLVRRHIMDRVGPDGKYVKGIYFGNRRAWDNSYPYKTLGFQVNIIDDHDRYLIEDEVSLDGMAMFIGTNHAVMTAAEFPVKPDSIYFTDDIKHTPPNWYQLTSGDNTGWDKVMKYGVHSLFPKWVDTVYGGHDIGICDYKNMTFSKCFYPLDVRSLKRIDPPPLWWFNP